MNIKKIVSIGKKFLMQKDIRFDYLSKLGLHNYMSDEEFLKKKFRLTLGYKLDLTNPTTFNEKLQWLKLYDHNPIYTRMVDKYEAKKYVAQIIGEEYIIPTLGVWDNFDDIDFDTLPQQFVLKCTHDSGGLVICKNKELFDKEKARRKINKCLKINYFLSGREWPYKDVKRRIIAEKFIEESADEKGNKKNDTGLNDYKLMCFNGKVKCSFVCSNRFSKDGLNVTFYDYDWNMLPFERHYPKCEIPIERPQNYSKMVEFAEKLSYNIPFLRVDFYEIQGKLYFGELTFFPGSGFEEFTPESADFELGEWIELPDINIS